MMKRIKWTNKYSGETGYVESIGSKEKHFVSTNDVHSARIFMNAGLAAVGVKQLTSYGEAENNVFEIVDA